jgi:CHASE3 domain sensor protein
MKSLSNMKIGRKLGLVLGGNIVLMMLVAGAGLYATHSLHMTNQAV